MATKHTHSSGAALPLTGGGVAVAETSFSQDVSVDPVTGKPRSEVTALTSKLIVLDAEGTRHVVEIIPFKDGVGVEIHVDQLYNHTIKWRKA